jgi:arylsulfatase A-like enzyme
MLYASPPPYQDLFLPGAAEQLPKIPPDVLWEGEDLLDARGKEAITALYDGGIRHVDANLEQLFGALEREGWLANALVLVTSDHGESLAQRGKLSGHGELAQEGLHVPLIVVRPDGARAGERVRPLVHLGDIVPTVLEAAGLDADARLPGRSLFGPLPAERVTTGTYLPNEFVVRWPEKLIRRRGGPTVAFDLERDPRELAPREVKSERYEELLRAAHPAGSPFGPPTAITLTEEDAEDLRALGYGGEDE